MVKSRTLEIKTLALKSTYDRLKGQGESFSKIAL